MRNIRELDGAIKTFKVIHLLAYVIYLLLIIRTDELETNLTTGKFK